MTDRHHNLPMSSFIVPKVGDIIVVADDATNNVTPFWQPLIGRRGIITSICADGLWDVSLLDSHPLIPGVLPSRFVVLPRPHWTTTLWRRIWSRLLPTLLVLTMLGVIYCILMLPSCMKASHG